MAGLSSLLVNLGGRGLLDPAGIVGVDIVPSGFELVTDRPHEVAFNVSVEDVHDALTEAHDLVVSVPSGIDSACSVLNGGLTEVETILAEGAQSSSGTIEIGGLLIQVGVRALNALALAGCWSVSVVETSEPCGTDVGGKRPFTNPNVVLDVVSVGNVSTIFVTVVTNVSVSSTPSKVLMGVHDNVLMIIIIKEIVPEISIKVESVMEDELQARLLLLHHDLDISVEILEEINVRAPPWLVNGLDGIEGLMVTPDVEETLDGILSPYHVLEVDSQKGATICRVNLTLPLAPSVIPVIEVVLIGPDGTVAETRVIESVLGASNSVHVQQDLDVVLLGGVKEPCDLILGAISAANVRSVGLESPVTDWESDDLNLSGGHLDEGVLSDPHVPMFAEDGVTLNGSKGLAEGVLVHADTLGVGLSEESVEERGSNPGLKDLPATNVGADHGLAGVVFGERCGGAECCNSE